MTNFIEHLMRPSDVDGEGGLFCRMNYYFGPTEHNRRSMVLAHGLMWLKGNIDMDNIKEKLKIRYNV